ncbi:hypothetical protein [Streptomyces sp. NPDC048349]|uniref:hypothetical protein n=1 Tax=Streptomyces sp. NPDC048349 TaxID=3155486 RepID=UPI0034251DE8
MLNGVDQKALSRCLATDPDTCLTSVPGLSACVQTAKVCNAAALQSAPRSSARMDSAPGNTAGIGARAAESFGVAQNTLRVTTETRTLGAAATFGLGLQSPTAGDTAVVTVESSSPNHGLEQHGLTFQGFRATYSAGTGQLLEACWGQMCRS